MTTKFNPKIFLGKNRVYRGVPKTLGIDRLYVWCEEQKEYVPPPRGKCYRASRYELDVNGKRIRNKRYFETIEEARAWQAETSSLPTPQASSSESQTSQETTTAHLAVMAPKEGLRFAEVIGKWRRKKFSLLAPTTQIAYEKIIRLYMKDLLNLSLYEITPIRIDQWLEDLKAPDSQAMKSTRRTTFRHELEVLSAILRYYDDYHEDEKFRFPIKSRHWHDVATGRKSPPKPKDLTEQEFYLFRNELSKEKKYGTLLAGLATVQYFEALRISEAAGIFHEDVKLNFFEPSGSRLRIQRSIFYPRTKGMETLVKFGFKNSDQFPDGVKELPIFPQTFGALAQVVNPKERGLVFSIDGKPIEYRTIQYYYDKAFRKAGLPYSATHVLRHGWTRELYNRNPDLDAAKQLLGDISDEAAKVYAVRQAGVITGVAKQIWDQMPNAGRNWAQIEDQEQESDRGRAQLGAIQ